MATTKYIAAQEKSGLKVGDQVRIVKKDSPLESEWENSWTSEMDKYAKENQVDVITDITDVGIKLSRGIIWVYPFYALEKVENNE